MKDRFRVRAWNEVGKYYLYDVQNSIYFHNRQRYTFVDAVNKGLLKKWKLEQCSGVKDKNGQLIYEGDIIKSYINDCDYVVRREKHFACFSYASINKNIGTPLSEGDITNYELEIIGNIHKNPELLEETK